MKNQEIKIFLSKSILLNNKITRKVKVFYSILMYGEDQDKYRGKLVGLPT